MITPIATRVTNDPSEQRGISANDARELVHITYRQLDHWARQGWVVPSVDPGTGRSGRRLYSAEDIVRLRLLRHLATSKVNTALAGPAVAQLTLPQSDDLVLWGPVPPGSFDEPSLTTLVRSALLEHFSEGGAWVVFDPVPIRSQALVALGKDETPSPASESKAVNR